MAAIGAPRPRAALPGEAPRARWMRYGAIRRRGDSLTERPQRGGWRAGWTSLEAQRAARARLAAVLDDRAVPVFPAEGDLERGLGARRDVLVVHDVVNRTHGVGVLLLAVFGRGRHLITVHSHAFFPGGQPLGERAIALAQGRAPRPEVYGRVLDAFAGVAVRRILCVPYYEDDARTAVALHDLYGAPLCTWLMDDQNVADHRIGDAAMRELLEKSRLRLAICPELRTAYQEKHGQRLWLAPPLVDARDVRAGPPTAPAAPGARALVVGNVWGRRWLEDLRQVVRAAGLQLDWTSPSAYRFEQVEREALARDGIHCLGRLEGEAYLARVRAAPFLVVPTGTLGPEDDRPAVTRYSLPSRMTYVLATSHTPMLVLGSPESAAARFVERLGVGRAVPYDPAALREAAAALSDADAQRALRARAAGLAPSFSAEGMEAWLWRSLELGEPADDRFERLGAAAGEAPR